MNKKEKYFVEKISYYKLILTILATIDSGIVAWFFNNYANISNRKFIFVIIIIFFISGIISIFIQKIRIFLERIGD